MPKEGILRGVASVWLIKRALCVLVFLKLAQNEEHLAFSASECMLHLRPYIVKYYTLHALYLPWPEAQCRGSMRLRRILSYWSLGGVSSGVVACGIRLVPSSSEMPVEL